MVENRAVTRGQKGACPSPRADGCTGRCVWSVTGELFMLPRSLEMGRRVRALQPPTSRTRPPQHVPLEALPGDQVRSALTPSLRSSPTCAWRSPATRWRCCSARPGPAALAPSPGAGHALGPAPSRLRPSGALRSAASAWCAGLRCFPSSDRWRTAVPSLGGPGSALRAPHPCCPALRTWVPGGPGGAHVT